MNTKCECGHQNPVATVLCEACGLPLEDREGTAPLEMKYDGIARRSQKASPGIVDRIWNFFSSVKVAIWLILITLVGASLGSIYPQESTFLNVDASTYYKDTYGMIGEVYYVLGLSHTYESWWFKLLLLMIGTSLVICSLDRVLPLYRALHKQQIRKHPQFLSRQKLTYQGSLPDKGEEEARDARWVAQMGGQLRKRGYRIQIDPEGTALLAEKHRFSRWGPYINHIGLIIFLIAVLMRSLPGWHMDQYIAFPEGVPVAIPNTPYYLMNEAFKVEFYQDSELTPTTQGKIVPKLYQTKAVLYVCDSACNNPAQEPVLREVHRQDIVVNKPLSYKSLLAYQFDYEEKPQLLSVHASLKDKKSGASYGSFDLSMSKPQSSYNVGDYTLNLKEYYPDFALGEDGKPVTMSKSPNAPAFIFIMKGPGLAEGGEAYIYFPREIDKERFRQDQLNGSLGAKLELGVGSMNDVRISSYISYLNIRSDKAMPFIWTGAGISMVGLILGFYWQHRRIWLRVDDGILVLGAHTNKNWFGLRRETALALGKNGITLDPKKLDHAAGEKSEPVVNPDEPKGEIPT